MAPESPLERVFERPPNLAGAWLRALTARRPATTTGPMPQLAYSLEPQRSDSQRLGAYRRLCGFADTGELPASWPQVMAGGLQVMLATDPRFPVRAMGLVHVRQTLERLRAIRVDEPLHLHCVLAAVREVTRGTEIDLVTTASVHGDAVWRSVTTALARGRAPAHESSAHSHAPAQELPGRAQTVDFDRSHLADPPPALLRSVLVRVAADTGRRYAALAGDWNPIHLYAITAKAFGFSRAIVHGMWSLARALAELQDDAPIGPWRLDARFRRPLYLPSTTLLETWRTPEGLAFRLATRDRSVVHVDGALRALAPPPPSVA
ncbi:MAG: hypothetical protein EXR79_05550 [Myxococcales bacterium]|nr:hypothetical protein [Myxococcales bacterium]